MLFALFKENVVISSMSFIVIIILLLLACASYGIFKTISHPAFITSFLWFCILLIYQTVDHGLYDLSDKFYGVLLLWNIGFYFAEWKVGNLKYYAVSLSPIKGKQCVYIPAGGLSALGGGVMDRTNNILCSVVSDAAQYRGGNNDASRDERLGLLF